MRIIFFGTPHFVIPLFETLQKHFTVVAVVTSPDQKAGRKQLVTPSPVKKHVIEKGLQIPVMTPQKFDKETLKQIRSLQADLFVVAAYGYILPKELLDLPPFGAINVHPSLLPKHRGPTPVPATILSGDTTTGVTIIQMDDEMDHGPILAEASQPVHETDTTESLLKHLFNLSAEMLPDVITQFTSGKLTPTIQDDSKATYTEKITKNDGLIDLANPPDKTKLNHMIRAYYPWPTVWTRVPTHPKGGRVAGKEQQGKLLKFLPGGKVQMEGKNPVLIRDFLNGYPELRETISKLFGPLDS